MLNSAYHKMTQHGKFHFLLFNEAFKKDRGEDAGLLDLALQSSSSTV